MTLMEEKQVILKRQQEEVSRLMQRRVGDLHRQVDKDGWTIKAEGVARRGALGPM